jgi:hypothetical protein
MVPVSLVREQGNVIMMGLSVMKKTIAENIKLGSVNPVTAISLLGQMLLSNSENTQKAKICRVMI